MRLYAHSCVYVLTGRRHVNRNVSKQSALSCTGHDMKMLDVAISMSYTGIEEEV